MRPGWVTFPLLPINSDGSCACMDPNCQNAGKHPAAKWGKKYLGVGQCIPIPPGYGIGVATGERSGIFGVDLDRKNGVDGLAALMLLGDVPETLTCATPTGGFHLYFKYPNNFSIKNSASELGPGIDIRGGGGYLVLPPSPHKRGGFYEWVNPDVPIAEAPEWLLELLKNPRKVNFIRRDMLERLAKQWKRSKSVIRQNIGDALEKVTKGESFAAPGERDTTLWNMCVDLAGALPDADVPKLAELFAPSLDLMEREMPDAPTIDDVIEKLTRAYGNVKSIQGGAWTSNLSSTDKGVVKASMGNVITVLENHPAFKDLLAYDERRAREVLLRLPPWASAEDHAPRDLEDHDATALTRWLSTNMRIDVMDTVCHKAIGLVARHKSFDEVRDYLEGLVWDGIPRLDMWLSTYTGAVDNAYTRLVASKFMISAVARALDPGCKVDTMLILEGLQGKKKSMLLRILAGDKYFADDLPDLESKDAKDHLRGPWIQEIKELKDFDRKHSNAIKGFIDQRYDRFREAYGHKTRDYARRNVFCGTTNGSTYLRDETGGRRFWPVRISDDADCDVEGLKALRDQLWAEAVFRYKRGERWWLEGEEAKLAEIEQEEREEIDPWTTTIVEALNKGVKRSALFGAPSSQTVWAIPPMTDSVSIGEILEHVLNFPANQRHRGHEMRISAILRKWGWSRKLVGPREERNWRYFR